MICNKCKEKNSSDAKYCSHCGNDLSSSANNIEQGSVDKYFDKNYNSCRLCGSLSPTKHVEFNQNIGMIIMRSYSSVKGGLCKNCINKTFWKMTLTTLFLGWWGTISFITTPFFLIGNVFNYIKTIGMKTE